jgi:predicted nucleic acid-binding protein
MPTVSNTSPISNLASIGQLDLLKLQFPVVLIPEAVAAELAAHPDPSARALIRAAIDDQWIRIATVANSRLLRILLWQLHRGEAEAIALAADLNADVVLIDEQEGRMLASKAGLPVTGVLGLLLRAKRLGHIAALKPAIDLLRTKAGFFVAPSLEARVVAAAGE